MLLKVIPPTTVDSTESTNKNNAEAKGRLDRYASNF